ncbi:MAG: penicillin-binding transpeptidase domain-containing protein [Coprococcus sp.]
MNQLWRNFCISDTYEPGSTAKTTTIATGLETGKITGNETYQCAGGLQVADHYIRCNVRSDMVLWMSVVRWSSHVT